MLVRAILCCSLLGVAACSATEESTQAMREPWLPDFEPPAALDTGWVHLEPLGPQHADSEYAAFMGCSDHLQRTLGWGWPTSDMTVEDNAAELEQRAAEFEGREAFAYTVQDAAGGRCLGCLYLAPYDAAGWPEGAFLYYWVVESELANGLDAHLLSEVRSWLQAEWPFERVLLPLRAENARGIAVAQELGMVELPAERWLTLDEPGSYRLFSMW